MRALYVEITWTEHERNADHAARGCERFDYSIVKITRFYDYQTWQKQFWINSWGLFFLIVLSDTDWLGRQTAITWTDNLSQTYSRLSFFKEQHSRSFHCFHFGRRKTRKCPHSWSPHPAHNKRVTQRLNPQVIEHGVFVGPESTEVWCYHFANFSIQTLKPHRETETVAVRTCANFQIASATESEDREVSLSPILTPLI